MAPEHPRPDLALLAAPGVAVVVLAGVWVTGAVITNEYRVAMWLTAGWGAAAGPGRLVVAPRRRRVRWPVLGGYVLTAVLAGIYLGRSQLFDTVVHERVA